MSKHLSKRILSTALAALLVTGTAMSSVTAYAADNEDGISVTENKDYFDIGPRKVGIHITNIPDLGEYEDLELFDEDGDGIYTGQFGNLLMDFPDYDEVSFFVRLDDSSTDKWGAENESGNTYGSDELVTVKLKENEALSVSFDARGSSNYTKWKINAMATLIPDMERLTVFAGDPETDSTDIPLSDDDGDRIYEAEVDVFELFGSGFYARWDYEDEFVWGSDGNGGTEFGSTKRFENNFLSGEQVHFMFDARDEDYHNWKLTYNTLPPIYTDDSESNLKLGMYQPKDEGEYDVWTCDFSDEDGDGVYESIFSYSEISGSSGAYAYIQGYDTEMQLEDGQWTTRPTFSWGWDGDYVNYGTEFGSIKPMGVKDPCSDGMQIKYLLDTRDADYHNWTLTTQCGFDLTDAYLFAVGTFSDWSADQQYMLFDDDGDGVYTTVVKDPPLGENEFLIKWGEDWSGSFWRNPDENGTTFSTEDSTKNLKVNISDKHEAIYISFDTNTGSYTTWTPGAEVKIPPYDFSDGYLRAYCGIGETELFDENNDGIYTGTMEMHDIGHEDVSSDGEYIRIPGDVYFRAEYNGDEWSAPDDDGITYNSRMQGVYLSAYNGDTAYISLDTRGGDYRYFRLTVSTSGFLQPLENYSFVRPDICNVGDTIFVFGNAAGGTEPYTYKYSVVNVQTGKAMDVPEGFVSDTPIEVKLTEYGEYDVRVQVKDADGALSNETLSEVMAYNKPLTNESTVEPGPTRAINAGETITMYGKASGGTEPYTFSYYFKRASANSWKTIKENTKAATATLTPTAVDSYELKVTVKDASGQTADTFFSFRTLAGLVNKSALSAEEVKTGEIIKINAAATGGTEPYTFEYYYKRSTNTKWNTLKKPSFTPTAAASYDVKVVVKDAEGTEREKLLTFSAVEDKDPLVNSSFLNSETVQIRDDIRVTGAASGGEGPYKYAFYFKRSTNSKWNKIGTEFGTATYATVVPTAAAEYDINAVVKDSKENTETKIFKVTVLESMALTNVSVINTGTEVAVNKTITISGRSVGGAKPVSYEFFFKRSENSKWNKLSYGNEKCTYAKFTPTKAASYDLKSVATDADGTKSEKIYTITSVSAS